MRRRYRQNPETLELVEITDGSGPTARVFIQGDIESFVSPVDGSVITDRAQLREHNKRNDVVNSAEFSKEHYERKAAERADHYNGTDHTVYGAKRKRELRRDLGETARRLEYE